MRPNDGMPQEVPPSAAAKSTERSGGAGWRGRRRTASWPDLAWPNPADPDALARFLEDLAERWQEAGLDPALLETPGVPGLLATIGGNSPYLTELALRSPADFAALLLEGPDRFAESIFAGIDALPPEVDHDTLARAMRDAKNRIALTCALADIGDFWSLETVTQTLSRLAESTLDAAVRHLLRSAYDRGRLSLKDPARPTRGSGYVVLAMGKLGARELNFSSDIDLVVLFDADLHADPDTARQTFIRMTSDLVRLMEARDANGYVFRTDLRLRPGGGDDADSLPTRDQCPGEGHGGAVPDPCVLDRRGGVLGGGDRLPRQRGLLDAQSGAVIIERIESRESSACPSWTNPMTALTSATANTTQASTHSPMMTLSTAAVSRM